MKCVIQDANAKVFAKAVQFLSRIGDELFIETYSTGLSLRTINTTKSSFANIKFLSSFFLDYSEGYNSQDDDENRCKLSMKSILSVFRNMKNVKQCTLKLDNSCSKLIVNLKCSLDTVRTHSVKILEHETLQAFYLINQYPNNLHSMYDTFVDIINNFRVNEEEITFDVKETKFMAKNYIDGTPVDPKSMKSQLTMSPEEFEVYHVEDETVITFCLRELRAFISLAETLRQEIEMKFQTAGKPVIFQLKNMDMFELDLVMSTVIEDSELESRAMNSTVNKTLNKTNNRINNKSATKRTKDIDNDQAEKPKKRKINLLDDDDDEVFNYVPDVDSIRECAVNASQILIPSIPKTVSQSLNKNQSINPPVPSINLDSEDIQVIYQNTEEDDNIFNGINTEMHQEDDIDHEENVADEDNNRTGNSYAKREEGRKKLRYLFRRCFEPPFDVNKIPGASQILAEDSDPE